MKNKKESVLKGIIALLVSQIFIKFMGLAYKLYLTNKEGFGDRGNAIYVSGFQIYALLLTFSSTGIPNAISKLVSERLALGDTKGAYKIFKIAILTFGLIGMIGTAFLFFMSKKIACNLIQIPEAEYSIMALSPSIFFVSISAVLRGYFNGMQKFTITAKSQTIEQIFKTIVTILMVELTIKLGKNNTYIMAASANLATTIATITSFIYIYLCYNLKRKEIGQEILGSVEDNYISYKKIVKQILKVAMPISLSSLISSFNKNIDSFTIVRFLKKIVTEEEAKIQYGILSGKIDSLCSLPYSFNIAFVTALVPNISKCVAKGDYIETRKKSEMFILISLLIAMPITAVMFKFSNEIIEILFPNALRGGMYLKVSSIAIIFMLLSQTINGILQGLGKVNIPPISFGIGMILKLICNIILIPNKKIGIYGAIIGNIICNITAFLIGFIYLKKYLNIKFRFNMFILKPIICTSCMMMVCSILFNYLNGINLGKMATIVSLFAGSLIYMVMVFLVKVFPINKYNCISIFK